jgi:nitrate reductase NapE component
MKLHLGYLLGLSAIIVAACAAFFSVYGLSQLFAGASTAVIVMATALEVSKLVAASFLHRYWTEISNILKIYLTVGVIVLVTVTSAGIYGFLTNAYQKTANTLMVHEGEVAVLDGKINIFKNKIKNNENLIESKNKRISQLSDLRTRQEVRLDSMINRRYFANANDTRSEIAQANTEIQRLQNEVDVVVDGNNKLNDSINHYEIKKLDLVSGSDVAAEVGPLKYMAELTGKSMDEIVNYFVLLLVVVFDPMAISLVIATGWVFKREKIQKKFIKSEWKSVDPEEDVLNVEPEKEVVETDDTKFTEEEKEGWDDFVKDAAKTIDEQIEEFKTQVEEPIDESKKEVKPTPKNKVPLKEDDLPEVKNRKKKFSVEIPKSNNSVERIGSNKFMENKNTVVYRNKNNGR